MAGAALVLLALGTPGCAGCGNGRGEAPRIAGCTTVEWAGTIWDLRDCPDRASFGLNMTVTEWGLEKKACFEGACYGGCISEVRVCGACGMASCAGCCAGDVCQEGTTLSACGSGGARCTFCPAWQACSSGRCEPIGCGPFAPPCKVGCCLAQWSGDFSSRTYACASGTVASACGGSGTTCDDCTYSSDGGKCISNACGCSRDADCPSPFVRPTCVSGRCRCTTDDQCATSYLGHTCLADGRCGCRANAECAASFLGATCLASGSCGCVTDTDCASSTSGRACLADGSRCGCNSTTDCADGKTCHSGLCY